MTKKVKSQPVALGKAFTFGEVLADMQKKQEALQAKLEAMTAEEREAWEAEQEKKAAETEKLLAQLRGAPGFMEIRMPVGREPK
jgi:hypothetical protein